MESLGYNFEERGLPFTEGIESNMDGFNNVRNLLKGWDSDAFWVPKYMFEGQGFMSEMKEKLVLNTEFLKDSLSDANCDSGGSLPSTSTITMNSSVEFDTRLSSFFTRTDDQELLITGLKVEKLDSPREKMGGSVSVQVSAKRARMANLQSQIPVCIVHGCNKDLSSSKEYHKRHKVCEIHSKPAVVIVDGARQRFCQQCSRFHMLAEFDNGKRSCRKRLAGHNERRRKPQHEAHFDLCRTSLSFSTYNQSKNTELLNFGSSPPPPLLHLNEAGKRYPSKYCSNSPLSVLELSNSSCAPSLLSAQSKSSFSHPANNHRLSLNPSTSVYRGISCSPSDQGVVECETQSQLLLHEPSNAIGANNVDLLQLSLHLQRVEHQKQSEQAINLGNEIYSNHQQLMH